MQKKRLGEMNPKPKKVIFTLSHPCVAVEYIGCEIISDGVGELASCSAKIELVLVSVSVDSRMSFLRKGESRKGKKKCVTYYKH